jgi:antitoxin (DNA-binding transcriptional repressor) of toxin-antitoxin stability system
MDPGLRRDLPQTGRISPNAHLSELVDEVMGGEEVCITRRGKPVAKLSAVMAARKPIDIAALRAVTDAVPMRRESAGEFVRRMRDEDRY